jgi:hypothetical protein
VFEYKVLRRIFRPKSDEVTEGWRKLHNEELQNLYSSPSIIGMIKSGRMRWVGHVALIWKKRNAYRILVGARKKETTRKKKPRWMDNIKIDLRETDWDDMDFIVLAQARDQWRDLVNTVMNLQVQ